MIKLIEYGDQLNVLRERTQNNFKEVRNMNSKVYQVFEESRWVGYLNTALDTLQNVYTMDKKHRGKIYFFIKDIFNKDAGDWVFVKYAGSDEDRKGDIYRVNDTRVNGIPWDVFVAATHQSIINIDEELTVKEVDDMLWEHISKTVIITTKDEFKSHYYKLFKKAN